MFRNLSSETNRVRKKQKDAFQRGLIHPGADLVVCDEGHLLKNSKTSLSKAVNRIRTLRRIVLTGTPLQNNLNECKCPSHFGQSMIKFSVLKLKFSLLLMFFFFVLDYCMVQFVKPNLLGKYNEYLNRFVNPITNGQYTDSTPYDIQMMKRRSHILHKMLDGCVQRRDYAVLAPFLPPKQEFVLYIRLTQLQIDLYKVESARPSPFAVNIIDLICLFSVLHGT